MKFFSQFRRATNSHSFLQETDVQAVKTSDEALMERPEVSTKSPAFAYIATTDAVVETNHHQEVPKAECPEDETKSQLVQDTFLGELLGLLFLIAFHGSVFVLKHIYVIAITMLSYVDRDVKQKYVSNV